MNFERSLLPRNQDPLYSVQNEMCRMLSGLNSSDPDITDACHLEKAKHFIDNCFFVGITEQMEESLAILFHKLALPPPAHISKFNDTILEEYLSEELRREIAERNWADIELYQHAKQRFEQEYMLWEEEISEKNTPIHPIRPHQVFTFDQPVNGYGWAARGDGFYVSEKNQRWVYQTNEASLIFYLDGNYDHSICLRMIIPPLLTNDIEIYVNDMLISTNSTLTGKSSLRSHPYVEYEGVIAKEILQISPETKIVIKLQEPINDREKMALLNQWRNKRKRDNCSRGIFACELLKITSQFSNKPIITATRTASLR